MSLFQDYMNSANVRTPCKSMISLQQVTFKVLSCFGLIWETKMTSLVQNNLNL